MDTADINGTMIERAELERELERLGVEPTDASDCEFVVGRLDGEASDEQIEVLADLGAELLTSPASAGFVARFSGGDLKLISALPFVAWVAVFPDELMSSNAWLTKCLRED